MKGQDMERVDRIWTHPIFRRELERIQRLEADRIYCRHDIGHLLDVARIAYIMLLEEGHAIQPDLVYAAALLHDIGRGAQYEKGILHEEAGKVYAEEILRECGYTEAEIGEVVTAIADHNQENDDRKGFSHILYQADKRSRKCFLCQARESCYWPEHKKNKGIWR